MAHSLNPEIKKQLAEMHNYRHRKVRILGTSGRSMTLLCIYIQPQEHNERVRKKPHDMKYTTNLQRRMSVPRPLEISHL